MEHNQTTDLEERVGESREETREETIVEVEETMTDFILMMVNNEYEFWQTTSLFLYDFVTSYETDWPSLTVEWLPDLAEESDREYSVQTIILGTHTASDDPNYLMLAQVGRDLTCDYIMEFADSDYGDGGYDLDMAFGGKVEIIQKINHDGEVIRARYMPQNSFIIATKTISSEVHVFDYRNQPLEPPVDGTCCPDLRLRGHTADGIGLSWSKFKQGLLLSGSHDAKICLWDINRTPKDKALDAMQIFKVHQAPVKDVAWHTRNESLFGSCGDDRYLNVWDLRSPRSSHPVQSLMADNSEINSLAFNPVRDWIVATGSTDGTVKLFDLRKFNSAFHTFEFHWDKVTQVEWSPKDDTILASGSVDRSVIVWDLNRMNQTQSSDLVERPSEMLFCHSGHTGEILDFSWNPCEEWRVASVAKDKRLHIWQMTEHIYSARNHEPVERARGA